MSSAKKMATFVLVSSVLVCFQTLSVCAESVVVNPVTINEVLSDAKPGDNILFSPGEYGDLVIRGISGNIGNPIIFKSQIDSKQAKFTSLKIYGSKQIKVSNAIFSYSYEIGDTAKRLKVSSVVRSEGITLDNLTFKGDIARESGTWADGFGDGFGLTLRYAKKIVVKNSKFNKWYRAIVTSQSSEVSLLNNEFTEMRSDGLNFAEVEDILIEENIFQNFIRSPYDPAHPDMIQFWTNGTKSPSRNIIIRDNVLNSGSGSWTQSIFMRNEMVDSQGYGPEMYYENVLISNNVIINSHLHGITVGEVNGLTVQNNTLIRNNFLDATEEVNKLTAPAINIAEKSEDVNILHNISSAINPVDVDSDWNISGNLLIQDKTASMPNFYDDIFIAARFGLPNNIESFLYVPNQSGSSLSAGSRILSIDEYTKFQKPENPIIQITQDENYRNKFYFQVEAVENIDDSVHWNFGDGHSGVGLQTSHIYEIDGNFEASARFGLSGPRTIVRISIPSPSIFQFGNGDDIIEKIQRNDIREASISYLDNGEAAIVVGQGNPVAQLEKAEISGFFEANDFEISVRLKSANVSNPYGEIIRIHNNVVLSLTPVGSISFSLNTANTIKPVLISTAPLNLHDQEWHDIVVRYDGHNGKMMINVDGVNSSTGRAFGRTRPMESWGLFFGNPWNGKTFDGIISQFSLRLGKSSYMQP